jgi:hypothetical protein
MSENSKVVQDVSAVRNRAEWHRPELRKLDVSEAQANTANLTENAVLS